LAIKIRLEQIHGEVTKYNMNALVNYGLAISTTFALLIGGFALLPNSTQYPYPTEIATALITLYSWLYSFNNIFPVDTLIVVVSYTLALEVVLTFLMPVVFWLYAQFR